MSSNTQQDNESDRSNPSSALQSPITTDVALNRLISNFVAQAYAMQSSQTAATSALSTSAIPLHLSFPFSPDNPSDPDPTTSALLEQQQQQHHSQGVLVRRYFYQLMYGCKKNSCTNPYCASNTESNGHWDRHEASVLAIQLAKTGTMHLCDQVEQTSPEVKELFPLSMPILKDLHEKASSSNEWRSLCDRIYETFSNGKCLAHSFQETNPAMQELENVPLLNYEHLASVYSLLLEKSDQAVRYALLTGTAQYLQTLRRRLSVSETPRLSGWDVTCLLIIYECPLLVDPTTYDTMVATLVTCLSHVTLTHDPELPAITELSDEQHHETPSQGSLALAVVNHFVSCLDRKGISKRLTILHQFIIMRLLSPDSVSPNRDEYVIAATRSMQLLYWANERKNWLPYQDFYNDGVNEQLDIREDFPQWKAKEGFSYCQYPFILNPQVKGDVLKVESMVQMRHELQDAFFRAMFVGIQSPYLVLEIRREFIIRDALYQLDAKHPQELKKQLRVQFVGEEGVDEGGVQKEFFQLVVREMFDFKYGMFTTNDESQLCWFTNSPLEDALSLDEYRLIGRLIGLAIYNSVILDVHFPMALYKKLMGKQCTLDDLIQLDPQLGQGFKQMLQMEEDITEYYERTFEVEYEAFGERVKVELKPGGAQIPLTNENRQEFVDLYVDYIFNRSVQSSFQAFKDGFDTVCSGTAICLFRPEEVELLVCGDQDLDFEALEKAVIYDGGYTRETPVIQWFWELVHLFDESEKKKLLSFTTGTDRVPIGGLAKLTFVIARNGPDSERLPTSHTCFNVLLLPEYASKERLKSCLQTAIQNAEGFGLI